MNWLDTLLILAVLVGVTAGTVMVIRNPKFWWDVLAAAIAAATPFFARRNSPEIEELMKQCARKGGTWDNFNKVCRFK